MARRPNARYFIFIFIWRSSKQSLCALYFEITQSNKDKAEHNEEKMAQQVPSTDEIHSSVYAEDGVEDQIVAASSPDHPLGHSAGPKLLPGGRGPCGC